MPHPKKPTRVLRTAACLAAASGVVLAVALTSRSSDPGTGQPGKVSDQVLYGPGVMPDRIILTWKSDPATTQAVTWRTSTAVAAAYAEVAPATDNGLFAGFGASRKPEDGPAPKAEVSVTRYPAQTSLLAAGLGPAHYHSVNFEDLTPGRKYVYRVGDGVNWSEWFQFRTAARAPEPFRFIYFGDAQNAVREHWSRVLRAAYAAAPDARFVVHAGDLINTAHSDPEWGEWFSAGAWLNGMVPSVPSPGNHEYRATPEALKAAGKDEKPPAVLSVNWRPQFTLPEHGPPGLEETVYYLDYQGVRVISLNSQQKQDQQVPWLEKVLRDNPNRWTVVTFHVPLYAASRTRPVDNAVKTRKLWQPLFDKYGVDLVLQGHDHVYARSGQLREEAALQGQGRTRKGGTVYVVSVSGPKSYVVEHRDWMERSGHLAQLYQVISVDGATLRYESRTATDRLYDLFELHKQPDGTARLVESDELLPGRPASSPRPPKPQG